MYGTNKIKIKIERQTNT